MPGYDLAHWGAFFAAAVLLNLSPGPDMAFVLGHALRGGRRGGTAAMLGVWTGALGHVALAACGLSAIVAASATAFTALKWAGAAYLVWLGVRALLARDRGAAAPRTVRASGTLASIFRQGVLVDLLNPKVALFFLAFLPQFVVEGAGPMWAQLALHGVLVVAVAALVEVPIVLLAARVAEGLRGGSDGGRARLARWAERASGAAMVGLGIKLAATQR